MKSCEFTTSEASTKSWFRTNGLIDKFLNILDLNKFRIKNTEFSDYAKTQYGVEGRLFYEEQGGKKALPNTAMFHQIDAAKGNWYKENEYLKLKQVPLTNTNQLPYESYITKDGKLTNIRYPIFRDTTKSLGISAKNLQQSGAILWEKEDNGTSRRSSKWEDSWLFNDSLFKENEQLSAKQIWEKYQATKDGRYATLLGYFFADRLLQKGDDFVGKLFRRGYIVLSTKKYSFAGDSFHIYITKAGIENVLGITSTYEDFEKAIEVILTEEVIHHTVDKLITEDEIETIYNELTQEEIQKIKTMYSKPNLSKDLVVHEYLRMILQRKHLGITSESELHRKIIDIVHRLVEYLKNMFQNNPAANIVINRFDEFLKTPDSGIIKELELVKRLMQQNNTTSYPITIEAFAPENGEDNIQCFI